MISVCMATYNGADDVVRQLKSILCQLAADDEVIVSDDGSKDGTLDVIRGFGDKRVRIVDGPHKGVSRNFENAIKLAKGDIIFLSDQDDEWLPNKVQEVLAAFEETECPVVMHDGVVVRESGDVLYPSFFGHRGTRKGLIRNVIKTSYLGCAMAFRKSLVPKLLPMRVSDKGNMHDMFIGLVAELNGGVYFLHKVLFKYYRYGKSLTSMELKPMPFPKQLLKRFLTIKNLILYAGDCMTRRSKAGS